VRISYFYKDGANILKIRMMTGYSESLIKSFIDLYEKYSKIYPEAVEKMINRFENYLDNEKKTG
jgi:hypothetical protein